jgi:type I restriction enzyme S subunit
VQSEGFFHCAVDTSAGSLSPRTKFNDLANYEFLLPPQEEQAHLAELLWAADEVVEREKEVVRQLETEYEIFVQYVMQQQYPQKTLSTLTNINTDSLSQKTPNDYMIKYIDIATILKPKTLGEIKEYRFADAPSRARRIVKNGDILVSMVRPYLKSFIQIQDSSQNLIASTGISVISSKDGIFNDYIFHTLFSNNFSIHCENRMNGTNYPAITPKDLGEFQVPIPDFYQQKVIANKLNAIDEMKFKCEKQIILSQQLESVLINQIF